MRIRLSYDRVVTERELPPDRPKNEDAAFGERRCRRCGARHRDHLDGGRCFENRPGRFKES